MGADIHIFAEARLRDGSWAMCKAFGYEHMTAVGLKPKKDAPEWLSHRVRRRQYDFFAALAGVRGDGPRPKGLPATVSPYVADRWEAEMVDSHSASWYTAREFVPIFMEHHMTDTERAELTADKLEGKYDVDIIAEVLEHYIGVDVPYNGDDKRDHDALRFVFWFDN